MACGCNRPGSENNGGGVRPITRGCVEAINRLEKGVQGVSDEIEKLQDQLDALQKEICNVKRQCGYNDQRPNCNCNCHCHCR